MLAIFRSKIGVKGLNLLHQQRNVRILNSNPLYKESQSSTGRTKVLRTPLKSSAADDLEVSDSEAIQKKNPKDVFISELMESLQRKDIQKLYLSENKQIIQEGSKVQNLKSVTGRLIEIKSGLRFQLVYKFLTNDITKNLPLEEVEECITNLLAVGFKRALLSSTKGTHELVLKRGAGTLKIVAAQPAQSDEIIDEVPNFQHDRKKNVPVDCNAPFLRVRLVRLYDIQKRCLKSSFLESFEGCLIKKHMLFLVQDIVTHRIHLIIISISNEKGICKLRSVAICYCLKNVLPHITHLINDLFSIPSLPIPLNLISLSLISTPFISLGLESDDRRWSTLRRHGR